MVYCTAVRDGDLGVSKLKVLGTSTTLKQGIALLKLLDPATHALLK